MAANGRPCWLPDGRIAYVQNAAGNGSAANNAWLTSLAYMNPRVFRIAGEFSF